ncbi:tRNA (adenosine(37)-N6)-threonylcarbamoyltransferase complex ATPase subunit type 1 TsaE [Acidocella aquatica]|uniref:tRNA threonylcarbamoyladenosine biosynthesis protein TsaE n=1 Tax=Acidocella aquatica TaxID=1922313 RepID=A0ABQ6A5Y2_9PROT|nr:tRNA (adenosine(37)-N6)-threonylcarbamoyltransferase complex ATPase subunit type 1 TsaE [Acidocella aquatica]GLR65534.1 tRNA (adenosine(37)-N6)-threonylcarbamoyltransferase complex ATPase subunit type 1 TsaE [Acidocella aquatica]
MQIFLPDEAATIALAQELAARARAGDVLLLCGPLGAGKTSFARAFIRALTGEPDLTVPSPTFTLVQQYEARGTTIWHYDLWRLQDHHALEELGWEEALDGIVIVEWPDRLGPLTPPRALRLSFSHEGTGRSAELAEDTP